MPVLAPQQSRNSSLQLSSQELEHRVSGRYHRRPRQASPNSSVSSNSSLLLDVDGSPAAKDSRSLFRSCSAEMANTTQPSTAATSSCPSSLDDEESCLDGDNSPTSAWSSRNIVSSQVRAHSIFLQRYRGALPPVHDDLVDPSSPAFVASTLSHGDGTPLSPGRQPAHHLAPLPQENQHQSPQRQHQSPQKHYPQEQGSPRSDSPRLAPTNLLSSSLPSPRREDCPSSPLCSESADDITLQDVIAHENENENERVHLTMLPRKVSILRDSRLATDDESRQTRSPSTLSKSLSSTSLYVIAHGGEEGPGLSSHYFSDPETRVEIERKVASAVSGWLGEDENTVSVAPASSSSFGLSSNLERVRFKSKKNLLALTKKNKSIDGVRSKRVKKQPNKLGSIRGKIKIRPKHRPTPVFEIGGPINFRQELHIDQELEWQLENPAESFDVVRKLGRGAYGVVYEAIHRATEFALAIKKVHMTGDETEDLEQEMHVLKTCHHRNIVQYYGCCRVENKLWIFMDLCLAGSLRSLLTSLPPKTLDARALAAIMYPVLLGLEHLHSKSIIHRDLKSANILIDTEGCLKIADFGISAQLGKNSHRSIIGTPLFMAPEVLSGVRYSSSADIWSLGITFIELSDGYPPYYEEHNILRAMYKLTQEDPPTVRDPSRWPESLVDFVAMMLKKDPGERAAAKDLLLQHPFLADFRVGLRDSPSVIKKLIATATRLNQQKRIGPRFAPPHNVYPVIKDETPQHVPGRVKNIFQKRHLHSPANSGSEPEARGPRLRSHLADGSALCAPDAETEKSAEDDPCSPRSQAASPRQQSDEPEAESSVHAPRTRARLNSDYFDPEPEVDPYLDSLEESPSPLAVATKAPAGADRVDATSASSPAQASASVQRAAPSTTAASAEAEAEAEAAAAAALPSSVGVVPLLAPPSGRGSPASSQPTSPTSSRSSSRSSKRRSANQCENCVWRERYEREHEIVGHLALEMKRLKAELMRWKTTAEENKKVLDI